MEGAKFSASVFFSSFTGVRSLSKIDRENNTHFSSKSSVVVEVPYESHLVASSSLGSKVAFANGGAGSSSSPSVSGVESTQFQRVAIQSEGSTDSHEERR